MKIFKKWFGPKETPKKFTDDNNTYLDILISLNKNFEVDLTLYVDTDYKKYNFDLIDYIIVCSRFLNFDANRLKKQFIEILDSQIKNEENELFIGGLISNLRNELENNPIVDNENNYFFIKPSQVFIKHIHEHQ